jgi:hypothetical protein
MPITARRRPKGVVMNGNSTVNTSWSWLTTTLSTCVLFAVPVAPPTAQAADHSTSGARQRGLYRPAGCLRLVTPTATTRPTW